MHQITKNIRDILSDPKAVKNLKKGFKKINLKLVEKKIEW